jgi:hypothetical protein
MVQTLTPLTRIDHAIAIDIPPPRRCLRGAGLRSDANSVNSKDWFTS